MYRSWDVFISPDDVIRKNVINEEFYKEFGVLQNKNGIYMYEDFEEASEEDIIKTGWDNPKNKVALCH